MNPHEIMENMKKYQNDRIKTIRDEINNDNIAEKIKAFIGELSEKRRQYNLEFASSYNSPYGGRQYAGQIFTNFSADTDIQKSVEYEALLVSILEIIKK